MAQHEWLLKRNCSLAPRQLASVYAALGLLSFLVGVLFTLHGAWYVLAFAMLEILVLALAFFNYARHATDHEHIALAEGCLLIECVQAGRLQQTRLDPYWTRITLPHRAEDLIKLEARGVKVEVGRFVTEEKRLQAAQELRRQLRGGLFV